MAKATGATIGDATGVGRMSGSLLASTICLAAIAVPTAAFAQARRYDIPAQPAQTSIPLLANQGEAQILISEALARDVVTAEVKGTYRVDQALDLLLRGSTLDWFKTGPNSYSINLRASTDVGATPDILVQGTRAWTLNTGIRRTENDSQPFVVIQGDQIRRSGAPNLETFLRNQLSFNAAPATSEQSELGKRNVSSINLRGLGERETLILVDGRRLPGTTAADGSIGQPNITGIPIASIERIEVLASSASGIYGNGATGGVVNIILRRDYRGAELSVTYGDSFAGGGANKRVDLTGGLALEGGRTNVTFSGSWMKRDPLTYGDREKLITDYRRRAFANSPDFYEFRSPLGSTPNIRSADGSALQLDPAYGGGVLSSYQTFLPVGYRGSAVDGVAPLVANAGNYSFGLADNSAPTGRGRELLYGADQQAATIAIRRDFNDWLKIYAEGSYTRAVSVARRDPVPTDILLAADAPNNPFDQDVRVSVPFAGANAATNRDIVQTYRGVLGAIVKLPGSWQAVVDLSKGVNTDRVGDFPAAIAPNYLARLQDGTIDTFRDVTQPPGFDFVYDSIPYSARQSRLRNDVTTASIRLAGPLPVTLPGGKPTVTISLERSSQKQDQTLKAQNSDTFSLVEASPPGSQRVDSIYGEINVPLLGGTKSLPLVKELLLTLSGRYERYNASGSPATPCFSDFTYLPTLDIGSLCPLVIPSATTRDKHFDPTVSLRWRPIDGITLRGSYATGYLTPKIIDLVRIPQAQLFTSALDPLRGNEIIGTEDRTFPGFYFVQGFSGGNTEIRPETSKTLTFGVIVQPKAVSGLRLSADWTRIRKSDNYFNPQQLLFPDGDPALQAAFNAYLARYPDRVIRGPASDGFPVGRITSIDVTIANQVGSSIESIDFAAGYTHKLFDGNISFDARATYVDKVTLQQVPEGSVDDYAGVIARVFQGVDGGFGALKWKGAADLQWSNDRITLGWRTRYFDSYYLNLNRSVPLGLSSPKVASQTYHDISGAYSFPNGLRINVGVNNVFSKRPSFDTTSVNNLYSGFGDPRLANFYLTVVKSF